VEAVDGVLQITRIHVTYRMKVPSGKRGAAERALASHVDGCPVAQTLIPCVEIVWDAEIEEV
jgi:uncharacterized OsmC-like protein